MYIVKQQTPPDIYLSLEFRNTIFFLISALSFDILTLQQQHLLYVYLGM